MTQIILPIEIETRIILSLKLTDISKLNVYYKCKAEDIASRIIQRNIKSYILSKKYFNLNADTFDDDFNVHLWINKFAPLRYRMDWIYEKIYLIAYKSYFDDIRNALERIKNDYDIKNIYDNNDLILFYFNMSKEDFQNIYYNDNIKQFIFTDPCRYSLYRNIIESYMNLSRNLKISNVKHILYYAIYNFIDYDFIRQTIFNRIKQHKSILEILYLIKNKNMILELYNCINDPNYIIRTQNFTIEEYDAVWF